MHRHVISEPRGGTSTILVGRAMEAALVDAVRGGAEGRRVSVLCQPATRPLAERYAAAFAAAGMWAGGYTLPDGEEAKQMLVVEEVYRHLNAEAFTRDDIIVGVGGGALTDVAGFVAGTYLRGIGVVYVPTTLLGAVDAAIGGKTGVNVDGKNLAGVFRHPEAVVVDIDTLEALPDRHRIEGAAEAVKAGFIADEAIIDAFESWPAIDLEEVVDRSIAVKAAVVNEDFTEQGRRAILNYGHTVGHALETTTGRSHGESVAIGMVAAGAASAHRLGFTGEDRQREVLQRIGLPVDAPDAHRAALMATMALDKKRDAGGLRMVLLAAFGAPEVVHADDATVRCAIDAIGVA